MPWFPVVKSVSGHQYCYWQRSERHGRRVKTFNIYVGPLAGGWGRRPRRSLPPPGQLAIPFPEPGRSPVTTTTEPPPPPTPPSSNDRLPIHRARDEPVVDAVAEKAMIARIFACSDIAGRWERPWRAGRYTATATWMPDKRLHLLAVKLARTTKSSPFGGLVDFGWRKKRYKIQAAFSSKGLLQIPDHTRFKSDKYATAEQNFAHTLLHEIAHATGTKPECRRAIWNEFGSAGYAREEMVADITAHIMAHRLGLAPTTTANVAWYVDNWSRQLRNKPDAQAYAEREALRAADYLTTLWAEITAPAPTRTDE